MKKWHADEIGVGTEHQYGVEVYVASEADARIQALEEAIRNALETLAEYDEDRLDVAINGLARDLDEALYGIVGPVDTSSDIS
jgi:hypothetical protein